MLRSRQLRGLARYVPAYDGLILTDLTRDPLIYQAEGAHRLVSLQTNIGTLSAAWELLATSIVHHLLVAAAAGEKVSAKFANRTKVTLRDMSAHLNRMFDSYETLDETFSAYLAYSTFTELKDVWGEETNRLLKSVTKYENPRIGETLKRVLRLARKFAGQDYDPEIYSIFQGPFLDAADIPVEDSMSEFACDKRLEFFLTMAERGIGMGIPVKQLRQYWLDSGSKVGYRVGKTFTIDEQAFDFMSIAPFRFLGDEALLGQTAFQLADLYASIMEGREKDRSGWMLHDRDSDKLAQDRKVVRSGRWPECDFMISWVRIEPKAERWTLRTKLTETDPHSWSELAFYTMLRNALTTNEQECPLSFFDDQNGPVCAPLADETCLFRKARNLMLQG
jgi:hypothetical protein